MNPFRPVRDKCLFFRERMATNRNRRAWLGFLVIVTVAILAVITGIYAIVIEVNGKGAEPIDDGAESPESLPGIVRTGATTTLMVTHRPTSIITAMSLTGTSATLAASLEPTAPSTSSDALFRYTTPVMLRNMALVTRTVFSTYTVNIVPTTSMASSTDTADVETTSDNSGLDIMTGDMFCLATDRPNNVYTLCPQVHVSQSNMIEATAVPNVVSSPAQGRRDMNPFTYMRFTLVNIWAAAKTAGSTVLRTREAMKVAVEERCDCPPTSDLMDKNRRLARSLEYALELVKIQQELLDGQYRIMEDQRLSIEEVARLWLALSNDTAATMDSEQVREHEPMQELKV